MQDPKVDIHLPLKCDSLVTESNHKTDISDFTHAERNLPTAGKQSLKEYFPIEEEGFIVQSRFDIAWENVMMTVKKSGRTILNGFSGKLQSGTLVAIIGASGCGKTSFQNYISGYTKSDLEMTSTLKINDIPIENLKILKKISGFVFQEDILQKDMTVKEILYYQARLKLPPPKKGIDPNIYYDKAIKRAIELMKLEKVVNSRIGDGVKRGISGGERKRVCIACELVTEPCIFMLDEPTTGLDSDNAFNVLSTLKDLAYEEGKLVVCTIHQPSVEMMALFDKVLVLHEGNKVYDGPFTKIKSSFTNNGIIFPDNCNPCEFLMNQLNINENSRNLLVDQCGEKFGKIYNKQSLDAMKKIVSEKNKENATKSFISQRSDEHDNLLIKADQYSTKGKTKKIIKDVEKDFIDNLMKDYAKDNKNSDQRALSILMKRNSLEVYRNTDLMFVKAGIFVGMTVVISMTFQGLGYTQKDLNSRLGALFVVFEFIATYVLQFCIFQFTENTNLTIKELSQGQYNLGPFYLAKTWADIPYNLIVVLIFSTIWYFLMGLNLASWDKLAIYTFLNITNYFVTEACGNLLSAVCVTSERAQQGMGALFMFISLFCGFFLNDSSVPLWLVEFKYISYFRYLYQALIKNEFTDLHGCVDKHPDFCKVPEEHGATESFYLYFGVLIGMTIVVKLLAFHILKYRYRIYLE